MRIFFFGLILVATTVGCTNDSKVKGVSGEADLAKNKAVSYS